MDDSRGVMVGRGKKRRGAVIAALIVVFAAAGAGGYVLGQRGDAPSAPVAIEPEPTATSTEGPDDELLVAETADEFFTAWEQQEWERLQSLVSDQNLRAADIHELAVERLDITHITIDADAAEVGDDAAEVPFTATWTLEELGDYEYENTLRLVRSETAESGWAVRWWYTTVHPDASPQTQFERTREFPVRAPILGADGTPIVTTHRIVVVAIDPARVGKPADVKKALRQLTDADMDHVSKILRQTKGEGTGFHPVAEMPATRFESLRPQLYPVRGLVFRREQRRRYPGPLRPLIGETGDITAEQLAELGETYQPGDTVGQTGLEAAFEKQLAGTPALEAAIVDDVGLVRSLGFRAGTEPEPLRTTLDARLQRAGLRALRNAPRPAAMVALDASTGGVRAAVFTPSDGFNRAFSGLYAPGSTLKVVTSYAALLQGRTAETKVKCPPRIRVADKFISNDGGAGYGRIPLTRALAVSCNTTYARLGARVGAERLTDAAEVFGFNRDPKLALPAATPQFPKPESLAEVTRAAIGQGRVEASPLQMASVAATVSSGRYRSPMLVPSAEQPGPRLQPRAQRDLTKMMRAVVTSGTGRALDIPGDPVAGKTGTAQFTDATRTHAWFIGFRGDLAFAVVVEGAGHGGAVAAPVAREFLLDISGG